ncbi:condensation domain-containing protein, partial [Variovorax sp. J22R115]|uniref:condensation domain-containing protein n=1 Tax=Variovorax sp. J22R115 TaxID=3053509 RepID=UPI002574DE4A
MSLSHDALQQDRDALLELLLAEEEAAAAEAASRPLAPSFTGEDAARAPLSSGQRRLWLLHELAPQSPAYNLTSVLRTRGPLRVDAFGEAVSGVVARHAILRTTFHRGPDEPLQRIHPPHRVPLPLDDLVPLPPAERDAEVRRCVAEETDRPFDLERGPALRLRALRLAADEHLLLISAHHIVFDGWSMGLFVAELAALYRAAARGEQPALPPVALQFADHVAWERQQDFAPQIDYWRRTLAGVPDLELVADRPPAALPSFAGASLPFALPSATTEALRRVARRHGATLFMALLAGFETLLSRYSGQDDFALGIPVANRGRPEVEQTIGFFVNTLALRAHLGGEPTFSELLERTRAAVSEAFSHQDAPFERVVQALHPERNTLHLPLVRVVFALQNAPGGPLALDDLTLEPLPVERRSAKFDLALLVREAEAGLDGELEYATERFDAATAARMLDHFRVLLEAAAAAAQTPIAALPMLTEAERRQLAGWNDSARPYPRDDGLGPLVARQAERTPQAMAVEFGTVR